MTWASLSAALASVTLTVATVAAAPLPVVATNSILGDLVRNVGGDAIDLLVLAGPGSDPHTFEPSPSDVRSVKTAKVFIENGLGLESWADKLARSSGTRARRVVATKGITVIEAACSAHDHGDHHHDADPHVWNDVAHAITMVNNIEKGLSAAAPEHAETFARNAAAYRKQLEDLDAWIVESVASLPENRRKLVTNHDVFRYFAQRYGFDILGDALGSVTTEAGDPSAARVAALVREIQASGVPVIFADFTSNPNLIQRIAKEAGVQVGPKLWIDSLGEPGSGGETYEAMMRHNVSAIVRALGDKAGS